MTDKDPFDTMSEECGVFGVYGHPEAANLTYLGLYALQHRGQEASGIVTYDGKTFHHERDCGRVADIFSEACLNRLQGHAAIGHNRYSTTGGNKLENVQPIVVNYALGTLGMVHNGNLINSNFLRDELEAYGAIFQSSMDSEVIIHLIAHSKRRHVAERIIESLGRVRGAYCLLFLSEEGLIGARDPYGVRPLSLGKIKGGGYVLASETCSFDLIEAEFIRDIEPGEIVQIDEKGVSSFKPFPMVASAQCVFEYVYFSRPDSNLFGKNVYAVRKRLGRELLKESKVEADMVIPVPDSGVPAALGYSEASLIPYDTALIRNHYVGRTFIEPQQSIRHFGVKIKLNAVRELIKGKRVVVIDDSLVRGTTARKIVKMIRAAGAKEIHVRISSPPIVSPCFYGIDTPTRNELVAASHNVEEIRKYITADSLAYLSTEGMFRAVYNNGSECENKHFCTACFSEDYPIPFTGEERVQLGLFEDQVLPNCPSPS